MDHEYAETDFQQSPTEVNTVPIANMVKSKIDEEAEFSETLL